MFLCPPRPEGAEGQTDDKPIPLPGVTRDEFKILLDFFYLGSVAHCCRLKRQLTCDTCV